MAGGMTPHTQAKREPWVSGYFGRNYAHGDGWEAHLMLFPARRLMTQGDEGRMVLAGLHVAVRLCWRTWLDRMRGQHNPRVSVRVFSDADEIAARLAQGAIAHG